MAGFLLDWVVPYLIWIVTVIALAFWFWHSRRHNVHWTDLPGWARRAPRNENESVERAAARLRYERETGRSWRMAETDPGVDPRYRRP